MTPLFSEHLYRPCRAVPHPYNIRSLTTIKAAAHRINFNFHTKTTTTTTAMALKLKIVFSVVNFHLQILLFTIKYLGYGWTTKNTVG